jgi:hypothetical protein
VLSELSVDVKNKTMPFGAAYAFNGQYVLSSMYQVTLTRENIDL